MIVYDFILLISCTNVNVIFAVPSNMVNNSELAHHTSEQLASNTTVSIDLNEEFDSLNLKSLWSYDIYIAQEPVCNEITK